MSPINVKEPEIIIKNLEESDLPQLKDFSCGNSSMDNFLLNEAYLYHITGEGITRILVNEDNKEVLGYCTIKCGLWKIYDSEMYPEGYREIPCIEISRLAVHISCQHHSLIRLGYSFMTFIILLIKNEIATQVGCRLITLNALPEKVKWYRECFGFVVSNPDQVPEEDETISMHLDLYYSK